MRAAISAGIAAVSLLAGCLDGSSGGSGGGSIEGAWALSQGTCGQQLNFAEDGRFAFGVSLSLPGGDMHEGSTGSYTLSGASGALELQHDTPPKPGDVAYCTQWARRTDAGIPADALSAALGEPVAGFAFRQEISPLLGAVAIGTAPDRVDRVALYQEADVLRAARLDGTAHYAADLYSALPGDPVHDPAPEGDPVVLNLPAAMYRESFDVSDGSTLALRVLNLTAAADVTFAVESPDSGTPRCRVIAFADLDFSAELDPQPLDPSAFAQTLRLNPADGAPVVDFDAGGMTAYLLPVAIRGVANGACTVTIRAVATAGAVLESIRQDAEFEPLLEVPVPSGGAYALGYAEGHGEAPRRLRWWPGLTGRGMEGLPLRVGAVPELDGDAGDGAQFDVLGLMEEQPPELDVAVAGQGGGRHLSLYGSGAGAGLGPFLRRENSATGQAVDWPDSWTAAFSAPDSVRAYHFTLAESERVALWSDGGLDTHAVLEGALASGLASDDEGAADGAGFRIVRTLDAGTYTLTVTAREAGAATMHLEEAGTPPVPDEALEACLIANGLERLDPGDWERLSCAGQNIRSLEEIAEVAAFRVLELNGNRIEDAAPLAALAELRVLSLADNLLTSVDALAGLPKLHTLVLAHNPLSAGALQVLGPLAETLRLLDLTGVEAAQGAALVSLRTLLPATTILDRDGQVVP